MRFTKSSKRKAALRVVNELIHRFPNLDFMFNLTENSDAIRYKVSSCPSIIHEINLNQFKDITIFETVLDIKAENKMFDA